MGLAVVFGFLAFGALFVKLWQIQIVDHEFYKEKAINNQTKDSDVAAVRGIITDSRGINLAVSATVYDVVISPKDILEKKIDPDLIATGLAQILDLDRNDILQQIEEKKDRQYVLITRKAEDDKANEVREFIKTYGETNKGMSAAVYLQPTTKRYYPHGILAAHVIGFVNADDVGVYGVESYRDTELSGERGRIITTKTAKGTEMLSGYQEYVNARDGYSIQLTIDYTIQSYVQKAVDTGVQMFNARGGFCIVMDPNTGAILGMASNPTYDLNDPGTVIDEALLARERATVEASEAAKEMTEEEIEAAAQAAARNTQWRNKAVIDGYEPGSTFKPVVVAAALEDGVITPEDTFYCSGKIDVPGWTGEPIRCSYRSGHGTQDVELSLMNSCNPALVEMGQAIGVERFYEYLEDFGIPDATGIDLPAEAKGFIWPKSKFTNNLVNMATASFGQRFEVTPLSLTTAVAAVINGGYLLEPYVVQSVTDSDGNLVEYREVKEVRQVISQETSDIVRNMMESVVSRGGGKNARVSGYRIGGKTGTSQTSIEGELIASFVGFAPADNPEIIVLLAFDRPGLAYPGSSYGTNGYYISGGSMAAPLTGRLIADILNYMGIEKQNRGANRDIVVPTVLGRTLEEAQEQLGEKELSWKVIGSGEVVTAQTPTAGVSIPAGSSVVLYMDTEKPDHKVTVPDVLGLTYAEAKVRLEERGLYLKAPGVDNSANMIAFLQSIEGGMEVEQGVVVEVQFRDNTVAGDTVMTGQGTPD